MSHTRILITSSMGPVIITGSASPAKGHSVTTVVGKPHAAPIMSQARPPVSQCQVNCPWC